MYYIAARDIKMSEIVFDIKFKNSKYTFLGKKKALLRHRRARRYAKSAPLFQAARI